MAPDEPLLLRNSNLTLKLAEVPFNGGGSLRHGECGAWLEAEPVKPSRRGRSTSLVLFLARHPDGKWIFRQDFRNVDDLIVKSRQGKPGLGRERELKTTIYRFFG